MKEAACEQNERLSRENAALKGHIQTQMEE